jgi:Na+/H+-dicarboxylate symporter
VQEHPSIPYCGRLDPPSIAPPIFATLVVGIAGHHCRPSAFRSNRCSIILGLDELMDMARTATDVLGNWLATVVIARWEGVFQETPEVAPAAV